MASNSAARDIVPALRDALRARAQAGGGWGYLPGRRSRVEPTSWAVLALSGSAASQEDWTPDPHIAFLRSAQTPTGLLADPETRASNYAFSALTALAACGIGSSPRELWLSRLLEGLLTGHGIALPQSANFGQDNSLRAWPWVDGSFSWVEPTAWCLLALKRARAALGGTRVESRIAEAERLLVDRCCAGGGWNYGNPAVLGQRLAAFVPTTAIALLALHDRREHPAVQRSLAYLQGHARSEQSGIALALSLICLRRYDRPTMEIEEDLAAQYARTRFLDNHHVMAMALCALGHEQGRDGVFDV